MNVPQLKLTIARWVKGAMPTILLDNGGTFTAGTIVITINGTAVTQAFSSNKNTTLTALAAKIALNVPNVLSCTYDATMHKITIESTQATTFTVVYTLTGVTGTITYTTVYTVFMWERQNAPRPAVPYITGRISGITAIGHDYVSGATADVVTITGNREPLLMLQAFGEGAEQMLSDLRASLEKPTVQTYLRSGGLAFVEDNGGVQNISALMDTQDEARASLDIRFRTHDQITDKPGQIENVFVNEEIFGPDAITITIDTITI